MASFFSRMAKALEKLNHQPNALVSFRVFPLREKRWELQFRYRCAVELGQLGPDAEPAVPDLIAILKDTEAPQISEHLVGIDRKAWQKSMSDWQRWLRCAAARSLGQIGPRASESVPALSEALNDTEPAVREAAAKALLKIQQ